MVYHVRAGAPAGGNGQDWTHAYPNLPDTLVRGATYYLAAGSYPGRSFNDPEIGEQTITIRKATAADHGSAVGWSSAYASQATFTSGLGFYTGYYTLDGARRDEGDWQMASAYGIRIIVPAGDHTRGINIPGDGSRSYNIKRKLRFAHLCIGGPGLDFGQVGARGFNASQGLAEDIELDRCLLYNLAVPIMTRSIKRMTVERCHVGPNYAKYAGDHVEAWSDGGSNDIIIRNNRFVDIMGTAMLMTHNSVSNWRIHGNLFMHDPASGYKGWGVGNGVIAVISEGVAQGWRVYNNNVVGVRGHNAGFAIPGSDNWIANNIWFQMGSTPKGDPTAINNSASRILNNWFFPNNGRTPNTLGESGIFGSADPFMGWTSGNFHLNPNAGAPTPLNSGLPLSGLDPLDPEGTVRGAKGSWDIGAIQNSGTPDTTHPQMSPTLTGEVLSQSAIRLSWSPASDDTGIWKYLVQRNGTPAAETTALMLEDAALAPETTYIYQVRAQDFAGNLSTPTDNLFLTTFPPDHEPPTAPPGLAAQPLSPFSIGLNWQAASDNRVVTGYLVYRDGLLVGGCTTTDYLDTPLQPQATHRYHVRAQDGAGNFSMESGVAEATTPAMLSLRSGLLAEYKFAVDDTPLVRDISGNGHDGLVANATWMAQGLLDGAMEFDGQGACVDLGGLDLVAEHLTIALWMKAHSFAIHDARLISKATSSAAEDHYWMISTFNSGEMSLRFRLKTDGVTKTLIGSGLNLRAGSWTHVSAVYDGSRMLIYQNGRLVGAVPKSGTLSLNGGVAAAIGRNPDGYGAFHGVIDEIKIYNRALAEPEIQALILSEGSPDEITSTRRWMAYR